MKIKIILTIMCLISVVVYTSTFYAQGSSKTIKLANGDMVWNLYGEWNVLIEPYGEWIGESYEQILTITQDGGSFMAVRMKDDISGNKKGSLAMQGELDKNGIKKLTLYTVVGDLEVKGTISEDGNKMIIDADNRVKLTVTRK